MGLPGTVASGGTPGRAGRERPGCPRGEMDQFRQAGKGKQTPMQRVFGILYSPEYSTHVQYCTRLVMGISENGVLYKQN